MVLWSINSRTSIQRESSSNRGVMTLFKDATLDLTTAGFTLTSRLRSYLKNKTAPHWHLQALQKVCKEYDILSSAQVKRILILTFASPDRIWRHISTHLRFNKNAGIKITGHVNPIGSKPLWQTAKMFLIAGLKIWQSVTAVVTVSHPLSHDSPMAGETLASSFCWDRGVSHPLKSNFASDIWSFLHKFINFSFRTHWRDTIVNMKLILQSFDSIGKLRPLIVHIMTYDSTDDKWTTVNPKHNMMVSENLVLLSGIMFPQEKVIPVGLIYRYAQNTKPFLCLISHPLTSV